MKYLKYFYYFSFSVLLVFTLITLGSQFFALELNQTILDQTEIIKPIAVKLKEDVTPIEKIEPPPQKMEASLLSRLAPDSFASSQDLGGGVSFGSGGNGPAVGGGGGFGTDVSQLVKDKSNQNRPPRLLMKGELDYPQEARQKNISGYVILKILVNTNGVVENIDVDESVPKGYFDQSAIKSIKAWKFEPAIIKGQVVAAWTTQKIKFELN